MWLLVWEISPYCMLMLAFSLLYQLKVFPSIKLWFTLVIKWSKTQNDQIILLRKSWSNCCSYSKIYTITSDSSISLIKSLTHQTYKDSNRRWKKQSFGSPLRPNLTSCETQAKAGGPLGLLRQPTLKLEIWPNEHCGGARTLRTPLFSAADTASIYCTAPGNHL